MALTKISTDGVKDDAITSGKIPANAVGQSEIASGAVTGNELAASSVTASKIGGNEITAAKLASGVQTTINSNANNRVITGSDTANTLEGESTLIYNNSNGILFSSLGYGLQNISGTFAASGGGQDFLGIKDSGGTYRFMVKTHGTNNGFVGIGETVPLAPLHIKPVSNVSQLLLEQNNATDGYALFQDGPNGGHLKFMRHINGSETQRLLLRSDGGLCFGSDSAAANALDDYEEGTWTPTGSGFTVSSVYSARYTKIGRLVHVSTYFQVATGSGTSVQPEVLGLPFAAYGGNAYSYGSGRVGSAGGNTLSQNNIVWQVQSGQSKAKLYVNDGGVNESMISGQHMIFSVVYEAA